MRMMSTEQQMIDIFWTVQRGRRFTISLTEEAAWASLENYWAYEEDPDGWTIERTHELVPIAVAEIYEGGGGEMIELDEEGNSTPPVPYVPVKLFWTCPRCSELHFNDLYDDPIAQTQRKARNCGFASVVKGPFLCAGDPFILRSQASRLLQGCPSGVEPPPSGSQPGAAKPAVPGAGQAMA